MPNWNAVLKEIEIESLNRSGPLDVIRRKYLDLLHKRTGRNVIAYYSGWLQNPKIENTGIADSDKNGFMATIHNLDRSLGLDLILHTPGGGLTATESIVHYLQQMFGKNVRAIIPQICMSAGTMVACSCKSIVMGKQSNIGPIDPQFGGIPASGVKEEFERALKEIKKDPSVLPLWQIILSKYHPTFLGECQNAVDLSSQMVERWLKENMLSELSGSDLNDKINRIMKALGHEATKDHSRHIHIDQAEEMGLKIERMENDNELQDLLLTVHHTYMHTFSNSLAYKIIENHLGQAVVEQRPPRQRV
jgi:hypothetical protein